MSWIRWIVPVVLLNLLACLGVTPPPVPLEAVSEATTTESKRVVLTAYHVPEQLGEHAWTSRYGDTRSSRSRRSRRYSKVWVVPLVDTRDEATGPVLAWATWGYQKGEDATPDEGLALLARDADGQPATWTVVRPHPDSAYAKAVRDAERRHGITSHPDAPVLSYKER